MGFLNKFLRMNVSALVFAFAMVLPFLDRVYLQSVDFPGKALLRPMMIFISKRGVTDCSWNGMKPMPTRTYIYDFMPWVTGQVLATLSVVGASGVASYEELCVFLICDWSSFFMRTYFYVDVFFGHNVDEGDLAQFREGTNAWKEVKILLDKNVQITSSTESDAVVNVGDKSNHSAGDNTYHSPGDNSAKITEVKITNVLRVLWGVPADHYARVHGDPSTGGVGSSVVPVNSKRGSRELSLVHSANVSVRHLASAAAKKTRTVVTNSTRVSVRAVRKLSLWAQVVPAPADVDRWSETWGWHLVVESISQTAVYLGVLLIVVVAMPVMAATLEGEDENSSSTDDGTGAGTNITKRTGWDRAFATPLAGFFMPNKWLSVVSLLVSFLSELVQDRCSLKVAYALSGSPFSGCFGKNNYKALLHSTCCFVTIMYIFEHFAIIMHLQEAKRQGQWDKDEGMPCCKGF